jgi:circadian clock protein KaiC
MATSLARRSPRSAATRPPPARAPALGKAPTGIEGFDEITHGGLPRGRPTLVAGGAGCGKTLFAMAFLVNGATRFGEPGVFLSFEERVPDLEANFRPLGHDLARLQAQGALALDHVAVHRSEYVEAGAYDLEGLFLRIEGAARQVGAQRIAIDGLDSLFAGLREHDRLRAELQRLVLWLKDRGLTTLVTAEAGEHGRLTRSGLEEYVADCVIALDHRVENQVSTRRLRVLKYRGSAHGTNEYPFLIHREGLAVLPVTSLSLQHAVSSKRLPTGVPGLDRMLGGRGVFRGASILVSGPPGTGKSTIAASFAGAAAQRGERALYFSFEESPQQIVRNMRSVGLDLRPLLAEGTLNIRSERPVSHGLEAHLVQMMRAVQEAGPDVVVVDPLSDMSPVGSPPEVRAMLLRLVDFLKARQVTALYAAQTAVDRQDQLEDQVSSIMDTWVQLVPRMVGDERQLHLLVIKSRGQAHSPRLVPMRITSRGVDVAPEGA